MRHVSSTVIDTRDHPPGACMTLITEAFDALDPGARVVLTADHDPVTLRCKLEAERRGQFSWRQLESGPSVWRAAVTRTA